MTAAAGCSANPQAAYSIGRLTMTKNSNSATSIPNYDALGPVLQSQQTPAGGTPYPFTYTYNLTDGITSEKYPSQRMVTTSYDNAGRVNGMQNSIAGTPYASGVGYAANNAVNSLTLGNGVVESTTFNTRFQPTQITAGSLMTLTFGYGTSNNNGNVQTAGIVWPSAAFHQYFVYDLTNRLLTAEENPQAGPPTVYQTAFACPSATSSVSWCEASGYDVYGNRLVGTGTNLGAPVNVPTSISAATNQNSNSPWAYDPAGNIATDGLGTNYTYDAENRQITAGGAVYVYDGDGRRVGRTPAAGSQTTYVYDAAGNLAAEYGTAETVSGTTYLTADNLGSTRLVTSATNTLVNGVSPGAAGTALECRDYLPFGEILTVGRNNACASADTGVTQLFTGKERDSETGLDYFGARYFSSAQGRWTSPDRSATPQAVPYADLSDPQTLNLYSYVRNNPLARADTDGHCFWDVCIGETAAVVAAAGATAAYLASPAGQKAIAATVALVNKTTAAIGRGIEALNNAPSACGVSCTSEFYPGPGATPANVFNPVVEARTNGPSNADYVVSPGGTVVPVSQGKMKDGLDKAGFPSQPNNQTKEGGTIYDVPTAAGKNMPVRVMPGSATNGPLVVLGTKDSPRTPDGVRPKPGKEKDESHIEQKP